MTNDIEKLAADLYRIGSYNHNRHMEEDIFRIVFGSSEFGFCIKQGSTREDVADTLISLAEKIDAAAMPRRYQRGYREGAEKMREFSVLRKANEKRQKLWDAESKISLTYRGNELGGECGELQNILKKIERERMGLKGSRATLEQAAQELGDVIICADLIAADLGIDLWEATRSKFNTTSKKHGFDVALPITPPQPEAKAEDDEREMQSALYNAVRKFSEIYHTVCTHEGRQMTDKEIGEWFFKAAWKEKSK